MPSNPPVPPSLKVIVPVLQKVLPLTVVMLLTTWVTVPLLAPKPVAPEYVAVMIWLPSVKAEVLKLACPLALRATFAARVVAPAVKVTVPSVTGLTPLVTVAVKVTLLPVKDGFRLDATLVVVA